MTAKSINLREIWGKTIMRMMNFGGDQPKVLLSDDFVDDFVEIYDLAEGYTCDYRHHTTAFSELLRLEEPAEGYELELSIFDKKRVILHRVVLKNQRVGTLTALMRFLLEELKGSGVTEFEVESVLTPGMLSWCRKYGLEKESGMTYTSEGLGGSYISTIDNLRMHFSLRTI